MDHFATTLDYIDAALHETRRGYSEEAAAFLSGIKAEMHAYAARDAPNPTLQGPFRLIHEDLNIWNIMVTRLHADQPLKVSGVIDWDYAWVGPLCYLCEYPKKTC